MVADHRKLARLQGAVRSARTLLHRLQPLPKYFHQRCLQLTKSCTESNTRPISEMFRVDQKGR